MELIFDGKQKQIFSADDPEYVVIRYKDTVTAYGGVKRARFKGIGSISNAISAYLLSALSDNGIETHFVRILSDSEQLCRRVESIPVEIVVHNVIAGTLARKLGVEEGFKPGNVIVDIKYNKGELGDPLINADQAVALGLMSYDEVAQADKISRKANEILSGILHKVGIQLVDFKLQVGRKDGKLMVCDEISPDRSRFWDEKTGERLDKDRFRHDLGNVLHGYQEVLDRLNSIE